MKIGRVLIFLSGIFLQAKCVQQSRFHDAVLYGEAGEFGVVLKVEFFEKPGAVCVYRLYTYAVILPYLAVVLAHGDAPKDLHLPVREDLKGRFFARAP